VISAKISVRIMFNKTKGIGKKRVLIIVVALVTIVVAIAFIGYPSRSDSFNYQAVGYQCSDKVRGIKGIRGFTPKNQEEFKKYCRAFDSVDSEFPNRGGCYSSMNGGTICEEYRAVLDILRRNDVRETIGQYSPSNAWVKALGHTYIQDKDYLNRILPAYSKVKIDCIIVVHSPEGTRFFIENGENHETHKDHQYQEVPSSEFLASLNNASDSDITNFWLSLH